MKIHILTLFPEMFQGPLSESIIKRAIEKGVVSIVYHNLRDFAEDKHLTVDDTPCGGGAGMVLKVDVMDRAIEAVTEGHRDKYHKVLMTPQGLTFDQAKAHELSQVEDILLICGHYEGFDERIRDHLVDEEISMGDFVLSGGEIPAMAIVDSVVRLIPGALGHIESTHEESFNLKDENGDLLLEYPIYTRPIDYKGWTVPEELLSGNHAKIETWRLEQAKRKTKERRG